MTSLALTMASTSSPLANARSSTASLVMDEVTMTPPPICDSHMGGRLALLDLDDLALELVSRAELSHGSTSPSQPCLESRSLAPQRPARPRRRGGSRGICAPPAWPRR